jgi:bacterioferritin-associated ferredoxin
VRHFARLHRAADGVTLAVEIDNHSQYQRETSMVLCICRSVTDREIDAAIREGARSLGEVARASGAGTDCGCCTRAIEQRLERAATCTNDCANCPRQMAAVASAAL